MKSEYGDQEDVDDNPLEDGYSFLFKMNFGLLILVQIAIKIENHGILELFITLAMQTLSRSDEYFNSNIKLKLRHKRR